MDMPQDDRLTFYIEQHRLERTGQPHLRCSSRVNAMGILVNRYGVVPEIAEQMIADQENDNV